MVVIIRPTVISSITLHGFKSFAVERCVEIRPLTLLAGANSSGKSSLMQPLLLMKQTLEAPFDPGALRPDGPHVQFTSADQLLTRVDRRERAGFSVRIEIEGEEGLMVGFEKIDGLFVIARASAHSGPSRYDLEGVSGESIETLWEITRGRGSWKQEQEIADKIFRNLLALLHVPGLRGNPERACRIASVAERFPGPFHSYTASVIAVWQRDDDKRLALLNKALKDLGLTSSIETRSVDATQAELLVDRKAARTARGARDLVSLADVGFGVSQILPVLVALLVARPGQLVYIEQPELHLHPRAQQALAGILADAAKRGVRVVAETHSDILLLAVQALVAEGALSRDLVKLHWFSRNAKGITEVTSADMDDFGAYGDWPEDFGAVEAEVQNRYLDAVEARARGGRKRGKGK